jgi:hypothetical protein
MSKRMTDATGLQEQDLGRSIEGVERPPEVRTIHVGRFSEGIEQLPETRGKLHLGRFSEGIEQLPETARKLRRGSFADGYKPVRRGRSHGLSRRHIRGPDARPRETRRVRPGRTGSGA